MKAEECLCRKTKVRIYCLPIPETGVKKEWEYASVPLALNEPIKVWQNESYQEAMGYENLTDTVALNSKAKENMIYAAASLTPEEKAKVTYIQQELIWQCSFNGSQCDIDSDFTKHDDPVFGSCFTFNTDPNKQFITSKSGPFYGLRILTFVNASDYLPMSEALGVRIAVHNPNEMPMPDSFGYNAPTGFISSFGLHMKKMNRLSGPYGTCSDENENSTYIYRNKSYTVEGCYRSCLQKVVTDKCGCSDPRYPTIIDKNHCESTDPNSRNCIALVSEQVSHSHGSEVAKSAKKCEQMCKQPCQETIYEATFSTAKWPSGSTDLFDCGDMSTDECIEFYRKHSAMVEVFFEKLNFVEISESPVYPWVNVIADLGGHIGLWLGFSVITIAEFCVFICYQISYRCRRRRETKSNMTNNRSK